MVKKALILSLLSLVCIGPARAEVSATNCDELEQLILGKYAVIEGTIGGNGGKLTKQQSIEVNELVSSACSPQFSQCGFSVCKTQPVTIPGMEEVNIPTVAPTLGTPPLEDTSKPLGWVTESMSCEAFLAQLRGRFQSGNLDENKRKELKLALDLACSQKFKHCKFEACQKAGN